MADRRAQYHTNGAAAYDVYAWNQSTAPQRRPEPQHLPEERPLPQKRQRVKARTALALTVVWFFTGLWHGASWNFVLWGIVLLFFILLEKFCIGSFLKKHALLSHLYLLVLVVFGYVQLFEATSEVSKLENQLSALQSQQTQLQSRYEARIDLDAIETAAGDLGLTKPSQEQIVYLDLSGADRAEIYQEEKTSVFSEIVSAMEQSVSGLIAYLRTASA